MANATGATEFVDSTTADVFIPEVWSTLNLIAREQNLVWANLVDRRYEQNLQYGDTIHVSNISNLTALTKTKASNAAISYITETETKTDISIATWGYVAMAVESIVDVQANQDLMKAYSGKMGYGLALQVDDSLAGLPDDVNNTVGALATDLTDTNLLRARQYLNDANVPMTERAIVLSPAAETGFLKLDKYVRDDYGLVHGGGPRETGTQQAYIASFYRIPAYVSTNAEGTNSSGHDNAMFHKEAFALVLQMKPTAHRAYDIDYFVDKVAIEQIYGFKEMRDDHCVWMKGP